ncbi:MBG domain-containing protein [Parapedobacter sp. 10938]|uniref:MBG domain-containing protein n=1 Tax=Parapedobacter flavus TaxID=3110225 RepID=UPI002DBE59E8|nr:MBG domain-containing protein [Parapedobacter sp. 10938]MEC3880679.1 MBG domain-containing protein [Parapedobacter sp. 10938]
MPDGTSVSYADNSRTDVGTQEVTATVSGGNYDDLVLTADLTVAPATITGITLTDASFVYDGTAQSLEITGALPDGTSVSYADNSRTDVGTQEVTATVSGGNYDDLVLTADLTVTPATITGIMLADGSFVYDGTAKSLAITGTPPQGTEVIYTSNSRTDAGTQEVTATVSGGNYDDLVLTADLTVTPATITGIMLADGSFVYDGTAQSLEITGTLPDGTSVSYADNSRTDVGTQEVTATVSGGNYDDLVLTADLTVTPATITGIMLADGSFVYDGTAKSLAITGTPPQGTEVIYTSNSRTDAGTQEVTATVSGGNYDDLVLTADLTVTPATITGIMLADGSFVYDGTAQSLEITGTLPDGTSVSYADNSRTDVGTQEVTATITGGNYDDLVLTADLTVTPATITGIMLADGSFVYDGTAKSLVITGTPPQGTEVIYTSNSRTDAGTQEVTATVSGGNYDDLVLTADLTVTPATITGIMLADGSFVYDGTAQSLEITGTLPDGTSVSYADNSRTDVGTQEVTATITGGNYDDLVLTADLTVTPATLTGIMLADGSFVYDGTAQSLEITGTWPDGTSVSYADNSRTDVGTQEVTATMTGGNYVDVVLTCDLTVTPATLTGIMLADGSFVYDGTAKSLVITGTPPQGTEVIYTSNSRTDAGTQEVTATVSGDNYEDLVLTANLTVTPATRSIAFPTIPAKTYGDADFDAGATASSGEPITYTSSDPSVVEVTASGQLRITGAGEAIITATAPENGNYSNRPEATQVLTVGKASQSITFNAPAQVNRDAGTVPLDVSASSGLPVLLSIDDEEVATLEGTSLNILRLGTVRITATQAGDVNHGAAEPVTVTLRVVDPTSDIPIRIHQAVSPNGDGINEYLIIEAIKDYPNNRVRIFNRNGTVVWEASGYNNGTVAFRGIGTGQNRVQAGTYFYVAEIRVDGEWKYEKGWFVLRY